MKERRLYFRKKGKSIVLEGKMPNGKGRLIWTLPNANKFYELILKEASFLPQEKVGKINEKVRCLAYRSDKLPKSSP